MFAEVDLKLNKNKGRIKININRVDCQTWVDLNTFFCIVTFESSHKLKRHTKSCHENYSRIIKWTLTEWFKRLFTTQYKQSLTICTNY